ncbi:MAG: BmrU protein [Oscillospiraceae bacterium]|nr:BmrU protein [Oscillospiraceae bacterium]
MRHVFIINPVSGKRRDRRALLSNIERAFPKGGYEVFTTLGAGDAKTITERVVHEGKPARIYACGGDGTLNEVANGAAGCDYVAITNVPTGTGNDFLRVFGKKGRARFEDIAALRDGPAGPIDLIDCNGYLGIDVVCIGIDARTGAGVHRYKQYPLVAGSGAYVLSLVENVFKGITRHMKVSMGPVQYEGQTALLCVCNGRHYGGGFCPMPEAIPDDGVLDMVMIQDVTLFQLGQYVGKFSAGRYKELPPELVKSWHGDCVDIEMAGEEGAVVDGEVVKGTNFHICLSNKKVNFFRPADVSYEVLEPGKVEAASTL